MGTWHVFPTCSVALTSRSFEAEDLRITTDAKARLSAFLSNKGTESPGMVLGMLSGIKDDTEEEIKVETKTEARVGP